MLLWCALVIRSIRPTRSVVETPCVRLHSLQQSSVTCKLMKHTEKPTLTFFWQEKKLTYSVLTSLPPHMYLFHPQLVLYHLEQNDTVRTIALSHIAEQRVFSTSMNTEVAAVLIKRPEGRDVRGSFHHLVHPLYGPYHLVPFFLSEDWRTLVLWNLTFR